MNNSVLILEEQEVLPIKTDKIEYSYLVELLGNDNYDPSNPDLLLGLDWGNRSHTTLQAKYFIGLKWIKENESAIYVEPKISNIDFMTMFMHCFESECQDVAMKLGKIYSIDFDHEPIAVKSDCIELTPMIIVHFLKLTQSIVVRGLKCNYIQREENLSSKIKGKILLNQTLKRNYTAGRTDRVVCRYQDYTIDCIENRVLKKALLFVDKFVTLNSNISCRQDLKRITTYCLGAMTAVSDELPLQQIKQFKVNPLYRDYAEALKVAKLILRRFSYNIELVKSDVDKVLPPFWIDMSLLFELYVYSQLKKAYHVKIHHHLSAYGNEVDFVKYDEQLIIDTKYIPKWEDKTNHENVRQLSGYARNMALREKILRKDNNETTILDCLIIFPGKNGILKFYPNENLINNKTLINTYLKFHKLAIKLPTKVDAESRYKIAKKSYTAQDDGGG